MGSRDVGGVWKGDPAKWPLRPGGEETLTLADLLWREPAAHAYWLRLRRDEPDWEFLVTGDRLEAWRAGRVDLGNAHGGGVAFTWDRDESRWKQIT
jgi:hypothetical protein